jgi:stage III sporulation protein SpoIIIAA
MQQTIIDDLDLLLNILPPYISEPLSLRNQQDELLEVVMDLGRPPEARFVTGELTLSSQEVTHQDIDYVVSHIGSFTTDNRAGIERTLHRISAVRNRRGDIVGLTCRVGRAVFGMVKLIGDLVESEKNILLLGRPGVGKTTMLREVARVLADELGKRVIVVDTSNEIAGDGDIPHPAIGRARRMQVTSPSLQHAVMIEAVENHMPEVIIIDEIGIELEAAAARTIAERGVQLIGTAHGNTLENLILNPTLSDLVGGIQAVTLGDEEARRRSTQKTILERKAPPTFDVVVEIKDFWRVTVHPEVSEVIDAMLRGRPIVAENRWLDESGELKRKKEKIIPFSTTEATSEGKMRLTVPRETDSPQIYPFGINQSRLKQVAQEMRLEVEFATNLNDATILVTTKNFYHHKPQKIVDAEAIGLPIYVLKSNAKKEMRQLLDLIYADKEKAESLKSALTETEEAISQVIKEGKSSVQLAPQNAYIRRLQHLLAKRSQVSSQSFGQEPGRGVRILQPG